MKSGNQIFGIRDSYEHCYTIFIPNFLFVIIISIKRFKKKKKKKKNLNSIISFDITNHSKMLTNTNLAVCPGDILTSNIGSSDEQIKLGRGLSLKDNKIIANIAGDLRQNIFNNKYYINNNKKFYEPKENDQIIGIIDDKAGDFYKVNVYSGNICVLNRLSFEGATKRNKPELKSGDLVYCRVLSDSKQIDTELTCITVNSSRKEWSSGETVSYKSLQYVIFNHIII